MAYVKRIHSVRSYASNTQCSCSISCDGFSNVKERWKRGRFVCPDSYLSMVQLLSQDFFSGGPRRNRDAEAMAARLTALAFGKRRFYVLSPSMRRPVGVKWFFSFSY